MQRDFRFDVVRVLCMTFIIAFVHLYGYVYHVRSAYFMPECAVLTDACLGLFTFVSGYLIGKKYIFGNSWREVWQFYRKRLLRIFPLFLLSAVALYLIGFNSARATLNGVLCISLFVKPRPMTLWYIPVILFCYLITPLVCRKNFTWRLTSALILFLAILILGKLVPSTDWRFQYNLLFYLIGLVSVARFDWKFKKATYVKWVIVALFVALWVITYAVHPVSFYRRIISGVGVFAMLFICEYLSNIVFKKENGLAHVVSLVSYASMAGYLFHRLFFWLGELVWDPSAHGLKWFYMAALVFPLAMFFSFFIQKGYDWLVERLQKK